MTEVQRNRATEPETIDIVLTGKVQQLNEKKETGRVKPRKYKRKSSGKIAYPFLLFGVIVMALSIFYSSSIMALIGISLTFWGALILFIKPVAYIKASLLYSTTISSLTTIYQITSELNYKGKGIYTPPKYFPLM